MDRKVIGALAVALALASCGSDTLSRADLAKQANAICRRRTSQLASLQKNYAGGFKGFAAAALPVLEKSTGELQKLKPPSSLKADFEQFVAAQTSEVALARSIIAGRRAAPPSGTPAQIKRRDEAIRALHFTGCP